MTEQELREQAWLVIQGGVRDNEDYILMGDKIDKLYKQANYVQLDPDQSLPNTSGVNNLHEAGMLEAQQDMLRAGFRKVEL